MTLAPGEYGSALEFSGEDYAEAPDSPALDLQMAVTISAWINPHVIDPWNRIVAKSHTSNAAPWTMYGLLFDADNHLRMEIAGIEGDQFGLNGVTEIPKNARTHVAGTYDGAKTVLYVSGVLENQEYHYDGIATNEMPLSIGRSGFDADYYTGLVDDIAVWNGALTAADIQYLYNGGSPLSLSPNLVAYYSCENLMMDGDLQVLPDDSGSENDAYVNRKTCPSEYEPEFLPGAHCYFGPRTHDNIAKGYFGGAVIDAVDYDPLKTMLFGDPQALFDLSVWGYPGYHMIPETSTVQFTYNFGDAAYKNANVAEPLLYVREEYEGLNLWMYFRPYYIVTKETLPLVKTQSMYQLPWGALVPDPNGQPVTQPKKNYITGYERMAGAGGIGQQVSGSGRPDNLPSQAELEAILFSP